MAPPLLPVAECGDADSHESSEARLRQTVARAQGADVQSGEPPRPRRLAPAGDDLRPLLHAGKYFLKDFVCHGHTVAYCTPLAHTGRGRPASRRVRARMQLRVPISAL